MSADRRAFLSGLAATILPLPAAADPAPKTVLTAGPGEIALAAPASTRVLAYNGQVPGPLLRVKRGAPLAVRLVNRLEQPTTLCWDGARIANAMAGLAGLTEKPVPPGESFDYRFTPPDAGLSWYHPHVWPASAEEIGRGLYGVLIVDEPEPPRADQDLLVVLDDWTLDGKGQIEGGFLDPEPALHAGRIGALVSVNGRPAPMTIEARPGARLRLRLLNACSARIAVVSFAGLQATVIAIDGQPSELFQPSRATIPIGPGARFEVMVDLPRDGQPAGLMLRDEGGRDQPLMSLKTQGAAAAPMPPVAKLPDNALLPTRIPLERSLRRELVLGGGAPAVAASVPPLASGLKPYWTINGAASDGVSGKPLFTAKRGTAVTLTFVNRTAYPQQMHIHGQVWRLLHDLDDGWDPYWRDIVLLAPGKTKHVAFVADNPGRWALESSMLARQVTGMATWFDVR